MCVPPQYCVQLELWTECKREAELWVDVGVPGDEDGKDNYDDDDADAVDEEGNVWHTSGASPCSAPFRSLRRGKTGQPEELAKDNCFRENNRW